MVAIATLIDICEQKFIAKTLQDREKNIKFLSFNGKSFFFICEKLSPAISNAMIIPWHECPSPVYPLQAQI